MQPLIVCSMCKKIKVKFGEIGESVVCEDCFQVLSKTNVVEEIDLDFITPDFEIANNRMSSACSMGMTFVKGSQYS